MLVWLIEDNSELIKLRKLQEREYRAKKDNKNVIIRYYESAIDCLMENKGSSPADIVFMDVGGMSNHGSYEMMSLQVDKLVSNFTSPKYYLMSAVEHYARDIVTEFADYCIDGDLNFISQDDFEKKFKELFS